MKYLFNKTKGVYEWIYKINKYDLQEFHVIYALLAATLLPLFIFNFDGVKMTLVVLIYLSPIWLTTALVIMIWSLWMNYIQLKYITDKKQESALYELVVPNNITKSPVAMELFFEGLLLTQGETTEINKYWSGKVRPWWSLEITGVNGEVKMYMWMWKRFREHVEAQLYAQFPEVELNEIEDYASQVHYDPEKHFAWGHRFKLAEAEALPIKTYFDYGLHEHADKWETKIDPMVNILERFALPKQGEQMWLQILFQKSDRKVTDEADKIIDKIYKDKSTEFVDPNNADEKTQGFAMLTPGDRAKVEAIERAGKKPAFDCVIRNLYFADKDVKDSHRIQSMGKMFTNYDGYNKIEAFQGEATGGDYPWEKYTLPDWNKILKEFIHAYKLRSGFHAPFKRPTITLTTEELATIFHFPSQESNVPGMEKKHSKTSTPPTNLPI